VALAQINTTVGEIAGNVGKILASARQAAQADVDIVAFPELTLTGYPPEDLLLRPEFIRDNLGALDEVVAGCGSLTAVVGLVDRDGAGIYNAAAIIQNGTLVGIYRKQRLPNYGVFDEKRYFQTGTANPVYTIAGLDVAVNVCEDIWFPGDPTESQAAAGAQVIININGSPYHAGKRHFREEMLSGRARDYGVWICYTNLVGGQDELVFDGGSMVIDPGGKLVARSPMFEEDLLVVDLVIDENRRYTARPEERRGRSTDSPAPVGLSEAPLASSREPVKPRVAPEPSPEAEVYDALVLGTRDYLRKTGFGKALVALSGGIDSSLVAVVAADALGPENLIGISMPSRYSSEGSINDARELADNLGIEFLIIPIELAHQAMLDMIEPAFAAKGYPEAGTAEENIQARIRGNTIMAFSNKLGHIVLTTGNKSEYATGYATLYGDMSGGYAVIKDVPKTLVYRLARYRNTLSPVIPESCITKPPSAELKPGQLDQDTLPPYEVLDPIIEAYVEENMGVDEIVRLGYERATVQKVVRMVNASEYKRRQAAPGIKITPRAFGRDWRLPIANRYRGL
ncbi:MAG TPA: NAD+ synthase, partial [Dehalococcoidia bacterium]|nr:NAD+ synthase [Dehalococcoidia bacterium]